MNTLYQPDIKDLMPGILIAWCDGALNAGGNGHDDYFELFMIVMLLLLMDFMSVMMSLMMIQ